jgi:hypothetical protein
LPFCTSAVYDENIRRDCPMKKQTTKHCFTYEERQCIIRALNDLRSSMIAEGRYTDTIDETLYKFMTAKTQKVKAV